MQRMTLKTLRASQDLTQQQAGEKVGVSKDVWHNWERGKTFPDVPQIKRIEKAFNISYDDIIFLTDNNG